MEFVEGLLVQFGPLTYENIDSKSFKHQQLRKYITCLAHLSDQTNNWSEVQLVETFIEGIRLEI
jgi:hypothetical protein